MNELADRNYLKRSGNIQIIHSKKNKPVNININTG